MHKIVFPMGHLARCNDTDIPVDVMPCGDRINKWFSQAILQKESGLKLVHYPYPKPVRSTNPRLKDMPFIRQEDSVGILVYFASFAQQIYQRTRIVSSHDKDFP